MHINELFLQCKKERTRGLVRAKAHTTELHFQLNFITSCVTHFSITGTRYLTHTSQRSKGLFWLIASANGRVAPRQKHHVREAWQSQAAHLLAPKQREREQPGRERKGQGTRMYSSKLHHQRAASPAGPSSERQFSYELIFALTH